MRRLDGLGPGPAGLEGHMLAGEGRLVLRPELLHRQRALAHDRETGPVGRAVVFHLLDIPAAAEPEDEAPAREPVEAGHGLGGHDGVPLRQQADAGAEGQLLGRGCCESERHEGVMGVRIALLQRAAGREGRAPAGGDVGVLGHEERLETPVLKGAGEF